MKLILSTLLGLLLMVSIQAQTVRPRIAPEVEKKIELMEAEINELLYQASIRQTAILMVYCGTNESCKTSIMKLQILTTDQNERIFVQRMLIEGFRKIGKEKEEKKKDNLKMLSLIPLPIRRYVN